MPLLQQTTQEGKINSNAGALDVCPKCMQKQTTEVTYICRNAYLMGHQIEASPEVQGSFHRPTKGPFHTLLQQGVLLLSPNLCKVTVCFKNGWRSARASHIVSFPTMLTRYLPTYILTYPSKLNTYLDRTYLPTQAKYLFRQVGKLGKFVVKCKYMNIYILF